MEEWLDVPQLAKETKIPPTTIHRYITTFNQFFIYKGGKRSRRYEISAIAVLLRIKELYSKGFGTEEVEKQLAKEFPVLLTNEQTETEPDKTGLPALATVEDIGKVMESNKQLLQENRELKELFKMFLQKDAEKTATVESLANQVENLAKALPAPEQPDMNKQFFEDQQKINEQLLQELADLKKRDELFLEKLSEKPEEPKKGFFTRFFKK
ncbi:MerR family transcriptional regulator [Planococcus shixiaomingii]|uniref:MerR family transcriptional regulator n=1 Tax=Planococcus shixiaomingii TaxID=3058393 RepID=UPI00263A2263|nr:MerR family transcriptional regulator [Planococcus sp. N022]WKA56815.1 MerR family transcriptional regulator [Planococcus sp. N022]